MLIFFIPLSILFNTNKTLQTDWLAKHMHQNILTTIYEVYSLDNHQYIEYIIQLLFDIDQRQMLQYCIHVCTKEDVR